MSTTTPTRANYAGYARAFAIFAEYAPEATYGTHAEHDEIFAGPDPELVSEEHLAELESLGWTPDEEHGEGFHRFT